MRIVAFTVLFGFALTAIGPLRAQVLPLDFVLDYKQVRKDDRGRDLITPDFMSLSPEVGIHYEQVDARILYPWRQAGMRFDIGLHLRIIDGYASGRDRFSADGGRISLNRTIPSLYASALFDLPFPGLSAGIEGSRSGLSDRLFDFRAKLQYRWDNGFGLQGGWQHQQMVLDPDLESGNAFTSFGPYLDLNWRF